MDICLFSYPSKITNLIVWVFFNNAPFFSFKIFERRVVV